MAHARRPALTIFLQERDQIPSGGTRPPPCGRLMRTGWGLRLSAPDLPAAAAHRRCDGLPRLIMAGDLRRRRQHREEAQPAEGAT